MYRTYIALILASLMAIAQYSQSTEAASNVKEVQDTVLSILRSARSSDNYATALAAQSQARAIAQLLARPKQARAAQATTPTVLKLQEIQGTVISIMRRAHFNQDYRTALIAAGQATHIARILSRATGETHAQPGSENERYVGQLQAAALSEMRKAAFEGNYQIALSAAAQATDNAELLGVLTGEITPDSSREPA